MVFLCITQFSMLRSRPELIVHSSLPIIQLLCSHIQVSLPNYSNDYDPVTHMTCIREAHIIVGFQTLGYIPLSCFLQSKLCACWTKILNCNLCHTFLHRPNSSKQALQRISQLPYCHSQALVQKFSSLHALLFPLGTICLTYIYV